MGTESFIIAVEFKPAKSQWSVLQIDRDSTINTCILDIILD